MKRFWREYGAECGLFLAGAVVAAGSLWCAWRLAGEPFYAACAVFVAAFWGSLAALAVWARLSDWSERRNEFRPSVIWPRR